MGTGRSFAQRSTSIALAGVLASAGAFGIGFLTPVDSPCSVVEQAQAATVLAKGSYSYTVGDPSTWGFSEPCKEPGYELSLNVTKVSGNTVTATIQRFTFYGTTGCYTADSKGPVKIKLKNNSASFKFKTFCGDTCSASIKVVSKSKVRMKIDVVKGGHERIALSTGGKWKTLKKQ